MPRPWLLVPTMLLLAGCGLRQPGTSIPTFDVPGSDRPWPLPGVVLTGFNDAVANLGPSQTRVVRLSFPREANVGLDGAIDVDSGILTVDTDNGCIEFLPHSRFRVKDREGREIVGGFLNGPTGEPNVVSIFAFFRKGSTDERAVFGPTNVPVDARGKDLGEADFERTSQPLPYEQDGSRMLVTVKISASSDFKGMIGGWGVPNRL